jgi:hypothetical protein
VRKVGIFQGSYEHMPTDGVVVDDEDGSTRHAQKCTRGRGAAATQPTPKTPSLFAFFAQ